MGTVQAQNSLVRLLKKVAALLDPLEVRKNYCVLRTVLKSPTIPVHGPGAVTFELRNEPHVVDQSHVVWGFLETQPSPFPSFVEFLEHKADIATDLQGTAGCAVSFELKIGNKLKTFVFEPGTLKWTERK